MYEEKTLGDRAGDVAKAVKGLGKLGLAAAFGVVLLLNGCYTIDQGERGAHTRLGALVDVVGPGAHLKVPFIDGVKRFDVRTQTIAWQLDGKTDSRLESYSLDQQAADIAITVTWSLPSDEKSIARIFSQYGSRDALHTSIMVPSTAEAFKNIFGQYTAVSAIQQRTRLNAAVAAEVRRITKGKPVVIESVQVQDVAFSPEYEKAVEDRMTAQVAVERKEQEKRSAQIDADKLVIQAEAEAKERILRGEAEAKAIRARADALASNARLVELTAAERWNGVLPTTMLPGASVPFVKVPND